MKKIIIIMAMVANLFAYDVCLDDNGWVKFVWASDNDGTYNAIDENNIKIYVFIQKTTKRYICFR